MHPFFAKLGRTVADRWKKQNFAPALFPSIARTTLEECAPAQHTDVAEILREFLFEDSQPAQSQSGFGQPELIVYEDSRFYIQLLFWLDGTTDIHQHSFSGAFHVLQGSSIHSEFEFLDREPVTAHLQVGNLRRVRTQLLETGSTVEIVAGKEFVHSLFHLETPSVTVVVRTQNDPGAAPQFTYLPPHLALDPFLSDSLTNRRKQIFDMLESTGDADYAELLAGLLGEMDFERGFFLLQNGLGYLRNLGCWEEVWEVFENKHGRLARFVAPTLEEILRRDAVSALRGSITEVELRFFLALVLNITERSALLELVSQRFEGAPEEVVARWCEELREYSEEAEWLIDSHSELLDPRD